MTYDKLGTVLAKVHLRVERASFLGTIIYLQELNESRLLTRSSSRRQVQDT